MNCCNSYGQCERGPGCAAGSVVAQKILGTDPLPELEPYEFGPGRFLLNTANSDGSDPDASPMRLTTERVVVGFLVFLALCDLIGMAALYFYR